MTEKNLAVTDMDIGNYLQTMKSSLANYAIRDYNKDSFFKSAMLAIVENESLHECLKTIHGKASLFNALRYAASTGLSLNPQEGKACLIAYGGKVQYQIMKNGLLTLAMASDQVRFITSDTVFENDIFDLVKTSDGDKYSFSPCLKDRGPLIGFFAAIKFTDGISVVSWMTVKEIEEHRDKYSAMYQKNPGQSPWKKSFEGMGIKTILKKLIRSLTISDDISNAIGTDDLFEHNENVPIQHGYSPDDLANELKSKQEQNTIKDVEEISKTDRASD